MKNLIFSTLRLSFFLFGGNFFLNSLAHAQNEPLRELSATEVLRLAEKVSPNLKASTARESQANAELGIAKSYLYPSFYLDAVDSFGFAGSNIPTPNQFGGLMNSPFRVGPSIGVLGKLTLFDLNNWYAIDTLSAKVHLREENSKVKRVQLDQTTLQIYFDAVRSRGQMEIWQGISEKTQSVVKTVQRLVKNGQYSEVQLFLIQDQADEAFLKQTTFQGRYHQALKHLALLIGLDHQQISCPIPIKIEENQVNFSNPTTSSWINQAEADLKLAQTQATQVFSEHYPKLSLLGSFGYLSDVRLVNSENYSIWIGLTLPLFEGFRISSEYQRAQAAVDEKENLLLESKLELNNWNIHYDEQIQTARLELQILDRQHRAAIRAFDLAKSRYLSFLEPLIHLKETIRNVARIEVQKNETRSDLLLAIGQKSVLNR
jgi:outer membrane protein TolC